jgi:carboxymethylenebutenolidase
MERKTASDFDPEVLSLFDKFVHGDIDRRGFLNGAAKYAVGGVSATMLLEMLSPQFAQAQQVPADDARIVTRMVEYDSPAGSGKMRGYLAMPAKGDGKLPSVLVAHENRGLNPHIEDIARRLALDGFLAFAPDALTPLGGYPGDEDKARDLFAKLDQAKTRNDFIAGAKFLNMLATQLPDLAAAVPFYGAQPTAAEVAKIKAPMLINYAANDDRINAGWPAFEAALKANGVRYSEFTYAGTEHGFNNDTTPRYDVAAAKLAWSRTVAFFKQHLA